MVRTKHMPSPAELQRMKVLYSSVNVQAYHIFHHDFVKEQKKTYLKWFCRGL